MFFGGVFPDIEWMEQISREQLHKSKNFEMQMTMYYQETAHADPIQPYSMQKLYDKARRFIAVREHQRMFKPLNIPVSGHARNALQIFPNKMDSNLQRGDCKQQAMFGK